MSLYCCYQIIRNYFKWYFFLAEWNWMDRHVVICWGWKSILPVFTRKRKSIQFFTFQRFFFSCSIGVLTTKDLIRMTAAVNKYFLLLTAAHTTMTIKWLSANDLMIQLSLLVLFSFISLSVSWALVAFIASGLQLVFNNNDAAAPSFWYPKNYWCNKSIKFSFS